MKYNEDDDEEDEVRNMRKQRLKNVILRIVIGIKERRNRPKLSEVMAVYNKKRRELGNNLGIATIKSQF